MTTLVTNDGREFSVDQDFVEACSTLKIFQDVYETRVPLPNVDSATFEVILRRQVPEFTDPREIFPLMNALDFLGYDAFLDDCAKKVAETLKGLRPDEVRAIFGLQKTCPV